MTLLFLLACSEPPEIRPSSLPQVEVAQTPPAPTTPVVEEKLEPRIERFTLETYSRLVPAGQTPPPCSYLMRMNQFGGYTTEMDDGPGVAWDILVVPIMDTVSVAGEHGQRYELVKVLVPDYDYGGEQWVQVNWFPAEAFVATAEQTAFPEEATPTIPGSCVPPKTELAVVPEKAEPASQAPTVQP